MTTHYLDIGVVRIQEYINRTSGSDEHVLRRRRGASRMVAQATAVDVMVQQFADQLLRSFPGWQIFPNDETYDTEGVAHLRLEQSPNATGSINDLAVALMRQVRSYVPQAYLQASWASASSYERALPALKAVRQGHTHSQAVATDVLPPVRDEVLSARCGSCGRAPANPGRECVDCQRREELGGRNIGDSALSPQDEALTELSASWARPQQAGDITQARDLSKLAGLPVPDAPGQGGTGKRNHLATVYADGNNVGALFRAISGDLERAKHVSEVLNRTTKAAGHQALADLMDLIYRNQQSRQRYILPGEVTTLAADDVLITVPASYGWRFVQTLVCLFNDGIGDTLQGEETAPLPSMTAGVVFHHCKLPIEEAVTSAFDVMRKAKDAYSGQESAIGWADLTSGETARARDLAWFLTNRDRLGRVAAMPHSQVVKYEQFLTRLRNEEPSSLLDFLRKEAQRDGATKWIGWWLGEPSQDGSSASAQPAEALKGLADALSLKDWYPTEMGGSV